MRNLVFILSLLSLAPTHALAGKRCEAYSFLGWMNRTFLYPVIRDTHAKPLAPGEARPISTSEATIYEDGVKRMIPFYQSAVQGTLTGKDGVPLKYRYWEVPNAKGTIVLVHGVTESMSAHIEQIYNLAEMGFNVYTLDQRGHGTSGRITDNPNMVYVDRFSDYVDDMGTFVDAVVKPNHPTYSMMGISMGGQIAAQHALRRGNKEVDKLILATPMLQIQFPYNMPTLAGAALAGTLKLMGKAKEYAPGEGPPPPDEYTIGDGRMPEQYKLRKELNDPNDPIASGASVQWVSEAAWATWNTWLHMKELNMPVLLIEAEKDRRVRNTAIYTASHRIPDAKLVTYPESKHGILREKDAIRDLVFRDIRDFLAPPSGTAGGAAAGDAPKAGSATN